MLSVLEKHNLLEFVNILCTREHVPFVKTEVSWTRLDKTFISLLDIQKHISGDVGSVLGRRICSKYLNFFVLDFDYNQNVYSSKNQFFSYVSSCIKYIQAPKKIYQSSDSGGIHVYFFIKPELTYIIRTRVEEFLISKGITLEKGKIELFSGNLNLRLPLGAGSYELDESFKVIEKDKIKSINDFIYFYYDTKFPNIYQAIPRYELEKEIQQNTRKIDNREYVEELKDFGISHNGMTNNALVSLGVSMFNESDSPEDLYSKIWEWVQKNHNNNSRTYNERPEDLKVEIRNIATWLFTRTKKIDRNKQLKDYLTKDIILLILELAPNDYNRQKCIFKLFQTIKRFIDLRQTTFMLSQKFLIDHCGFTSQNYQFIINKLCEEGYLKLVKWGNTLRQHPNLYCWSGPDLQCSDGYDKIEQILVNHESFELLSKHTKKSIEQELS